MDPRDEKLAQVLVQHSCRLQKKEKVLIECRGVEGTPLVDALVREIYRVGGFPYVNIYNETTQRELLMGAGKELLDTLTARDKAFMEQMDAFIGIGAPENTNENKDVPFERMEGYDKHYGKHVHTDTRVPKTKWVVLRYPTAGMAQHFGSSRESFRNFYYKVCNLDYSKLAEAMQPLKALMEGTDRVHIKAPGTDISFSIKSMITKPCYGRLNIPDGEIFTAPVKDSVNGFITYNTPSDFQGFNYRDVHLEFENGRIVKATSNDTERINKVLDTDEGARYIGEFALGVNPHITAPMNSTLFDEKIMGSLHFTPGNSYKDVPNGNSSAIHWDLVLIQTRQWGGGEIYFDDVLVRKDGYFVIPELSALNPENFVD